MPTLEKISYIQINEQGLIVSNYSPITNKEWGQYFFSQMQRDHRGTIISQIDNEFYVVEAFDEPFIAIDIDLTNEPLLKMPYNFTSSFDLHKLRLDPWDRFHGRTNTGIPFVLSNSAQAKLFDLVDEFDDDSLTFKGERIEIGQWLIDSESVCNSDYWSNIYKNCIQQNTAPDWDLLQPSPILLDFFPKLKLSKSRILVLGAGTGHDAAYLAQQGHFVTAIDFSPEAIAHMTHLYGQQAQLNILKENIFNLSHEYFNSFDLIFEHACFCTLNPTLRQKIVKLWSQLLCENGLLLGQFFVHGATTQPPFGSTEWELREYCKKGFRTLHWERCRNSIPERIGRELLIYLQKK